MVKHGISFLPQHGFSVSWEPGETHFSLAGREGGPLHLEPPYPAGNNLHLTAVTRGRDEL